MDCADYRIHSDSTADSTGYNLLYGLSPDSVTISPCESIMLSRGFWGLRDNNGNVCEGITGTVDPIKGFSWYEKRLQSN